MQRFRQLMFVLSLLALNWFGMMAVHELGHVLGAIATGGSIERVVLHPLAISRTDVAPNPHPAIVVWLGPITGCVLPLGALFAVPRRFRFAQGTAQFFAGFCLIANGAYISIGWFDQVGDCREMLQTGTPVWVMVLFGVAAIPSGLCLWHGLGSVKQFITNPKLVSPQMAYSAVSALVILVALESALSPR